MSGGVETAPYVILDTSLGHIVLELYVRHAPRTCLNFSELARTGYYDGTIFHRVIRGFMAQGGDPTGTGRGGSSIYGGRFADELTRELKHTGAGILSSANSGPNTNTSQFFLTFAPCPWLDGKHTIFGRVFSGMHILKRLDMVACDALDKPLDPVTIYRAYPAQTPQEKSHLSSSVNRVAMASSSLNAPQSRPQLTNR